MGTSVQRPVMVTRDPRELYLDLMKKCLTRYVCEETLKPYEVPAWGGPVKRWLKRRLVEALRARGIETFERAPFDREARALGRDSPMEAETMIGLRRLDNLQECVTTVIREGIPGDLVETGVWRADSFQGLPAPNVTAYPADSAAWWHNRKDLAVSLEAVKQNFARYGMLDSQVEFLEGWFKDTLPTAPIDRCAVIRLDGDMYESTMDSLKNLYPKLSPGGFVIVDDYGLVEDTCRRAVHDFRDAHSIHEPIIDIDGWGVYWRRTPVRVR